MGLSTAIMIDNTNEPITIHGPSAPLWDKNSSNSAASASPLSELGRLQAELDLQRQRLAESGRDREEYREIKMEVNMLRQTVHMLVSERDAENPFGSGSIVTGPPSYHSGEPVS